MESDGGVFRSEVREYSDALDGIYPLDRWSHHGDRAFGDFEDLEICYSWSRRCARALAELKNNLLRFKDEENLDFETLVTTGRSYSFITSIVALTVARIEQLDQQSAFERISQRLAARRLIQFGEDGARSVVCGRPYPCALDGLLDVHGRVDVLVFSLGRSVIAAIEHSLPNLMSRSLLLVPFYAGRADNELVPADGLDPSSVSTLQKSLGFRESIVQVYQKANTARIFTEVHSFAGQEVLSNIRAELSMLTQEPAGSSPVRVSLNDTRADEPALDEDSTPGGRRMARCHATALAGYLQAARCLGGDPTDQQAYDWLNENEARLPVPFETWARYLREARKHQGLQKNQRRAGRIGRSIVRSNEIELPRKKRDRTRSG